MLSRIALAQPQLPNDQLNLPARVAPELRAAPPTIPKSVIWVSSNFGAPLRG
jgi:hypothetical protein